MGTITSTAQIGRVRKTLADPARKWWSDADLLSALNDSIALAVAAQPSLHVVVGQMPLQAGVLQTIPERGIMLMDVYANSEGTAVLQEAIAEFGRVRRDWRKVSADKTLYAFHDRRMPKDYQVYPPAADGDHVVGAYAALPAAIAVGEAIPLDDWTALPLWALMLGVAYAANTERQDLAKATGYTKQGFELFQAPKANLELGPVPDREGRH